MTTLVTGGRGKVARHLIGLLHARGSAVRAGSADPDGLDLPVGVPAVRCDLGDPATFTAALEGVTAVFLYADASYAEEFLVEADRAGVRHIVLLSSAAVLAPDPGANAIARLHLDAEKALAASSIASTLLRPGAFAANALQWAPALRAAGAVDLPYPRAHTDPIHEADIAEVALAAFDAARPGCAAHTLTGPESLTFQQQLDRIAQVTGRPVAVNAVSRETARKSMAAHMPEAVVDVLLDMWESAQDTPAEITRTVEQLTGRPARSFAAWIEDHAGHFIL
ncbi:NAD(P)H-binding protein [Streptomyces sp. NPDC002055]|uniref:NAD(P)H-binding protein n=1 Tax=Streptomyces sp. NPDC002055 TaxID=3154534 RepID=UPI00332E457E